MLTKSSHLKIQAWMFSSIHSFTIIKAVLNFLTSSPQLKCFNNGKTVVYWGIFRTVLIHFIFHALMCIMCTKNQQNAINSTDIFLLWYFHLHVLASNLTYAIHILHSVHKYRPIEKVMSMLHSAHKVNNWAP